MMEQSAETKRSVPDLGAIQEKVVAKRFDDALTELAGLLQAEPDNPDALYMSAVCRRYTRDFDTALGLIEQLKQSWPEHGRAHQLAGPARDIAQKRPGQAGRTGHGATRSTAGVAAAAACRARPYLAA